MKYKYQTYNNKKFNFLMAARAFPAMLIYPLVYLLNYNFDISK